MDEEGAAEFDLKFVLQMTAIRNLPEKLPRFKQQFTSKTTDNKQTKDNMKK